MADNSQKMDIAKLCLDMGAAKAEEIPASKLVFQPELRELCRQNACGRYARNYMCPPYIGEVNELIKTLKTFEKVVIWQNIYPLEDSFDFEGMMDAREHHNTMTLDIAAKIYVEFGRRDALVLAAGGCSLCETCAISTDSPCRHPDSALSSLEAYGINVSKISEVSGMNYINGPKTVTYFSGAFWRSSAR